MRTWALIASLAGLAAATAAQAGPVVILPAAVVTQRASGGADGIPATSFPTIPGFGPVVSVGASPPVTIGAGSWSAVGSAAAPAPSLTGSVTAFLNGATIPPNISTSSFSAEAGYNGFISYSFEILGPTASVPVQVTALASLVTSPFGLESNVQANIQLGVIRPDADGNVLDTVLSDRTWMALGDHSADVLGSGLTGFAGGFSETGVYGLATNTIYTVFLQDSVSTVVDFPGGTTTVTGALDPTFKVGPGVANPGDYTFFFSSGIGNDPAQGGVPEPAAWILMLGGFGLAGAALRRQRTLDA